MKPPAISKSKEYLKLVEDVLAEFDLAKKDIVTFAKKRGSEAYWNAGKFIQNHYLKNESRADYGKFLFNSLEEDTKISQSELHRMVQFYKQEPILAHVRELTWDKVRLLLPVENEAKRERLFEAAIKKNLSKDELKAKVDELNVSDDKKFKEFTKLKLSVGEPYIYPLKDVEGEGVLEVDMGFRNYDACDEANSEGWKEKSLVTPKDPFSKLTEFKPFNKDSKMPFTYYAKLLKIVDGDTLSVKAHLAGINSAKVYIRLSQIDSPEVSVKAGREAKVFVETLLKDVQYVIASTHSMDARGRWIGEVLFLPNVTDVSQILSQGRFLNQEILNAGHAALWRE